MESKYRRLCCHRKGQEFEMGETMDEVMESLLPCASFSTLLHSMERLLQKCVNDNDKNVCLERWVDFGYRLQNAANRLTRERASEHNSRTWPLTFDLTVKVFSLLGTRNLCSVAASCSMFYKAAMDSACYGDVDLTTSGCNISNGTVSRMVERAGQYLRSLKLGVLVQQREGQVGALKPVGTKVDGRPKYRGVSGRSPYDTYSDHDRGMFLLTRSCLDFLGLENGAMGALLKALHLFNIDGMDTKSLCKAISCCPSLTDLEVVGLHVRLREALQCISCHCCNLERLVFQPSETSRPEGIRTGTCIQLVKGCPNLSSLTLRGFINLNDRKARILLKGFCHLKFVEFSSAYPVSGTFLRTLAGSGDELLLESLILRDCMQLKKVEVEHFLLALSSGECKSLRHLDVSNKDGLAAANWFGRRFGPSEEAISRIQSQRPELCLVAEFPDEKRCNDSEALQLNLGSPDFLSVYTSNSTDTTSSDNDDNDVDLEYFNQFWDVRFQEIIADGDLRYQFEFQEGDL